MTESWLPAARELVAWAKADGWRDGAHSIVALDGDRVVGTAICDLYTDDWGDTRVCCAEATDPSSPGARADVAAVMGAVMRHVAALADAAAGKPVLEFDGHVTDPHFAPLLRTIPGAFGPVCELLEVP